MTTLRITVEWLDGAYHGREWPPSPFRLYQAMLAGYAVHQRGNPVLKAAMRHLETLAPPTISAPLTDTQSPVTACVPNNDGDRVLALLAAGKPAGARALRAKSVTLRTRRARRFDGVVTYDWPATPATAEHIAAIATIAACLSALGLGIDVAVADAALFAQPGAARGVRYAPPRPGDEHSMSPTAARSRTSKYATARYAHAWAATRWPRCGSQRRDRSDMSASSTFRAFGAQASRCEAPTTHPLQSKVRGQWTLQRWCAMRSDASHDAHASARPRSPSSWGTATPRSGSGSSLCPTPATGMPTAGSGGSC